MSKDKKFQIEFDREMLRAGVFSVFWAAITSRRELGEKFKFQDLANRLGVGKSVVSKWFSDPDRQNCNLNTISDIAHELDLDLHIEATDKKTGMRYGPHGVIAVVSPVISKSGRNNNTATIQTPTPSIMNQGQMTLSR